MKLKEAIKSIIFIGIFLLLLTGVSYIVRTNGDVKNRFAGFYAQEKNSIDVMMFGASPVGVSFAPGYMWKEYGFTSYPLSSNTQRPKAIKYLIEEAYKYQKPEVVVIELRMFTYEDEVLATDEAHTREVTDNMRYSWQRIKTVNALTDQLDDKVSYYFDIMKFHSNWTMLLIPEELQKVTYAKEDLHKGFEYPDTIMYHRNRVVFDTEETLPIPMEQELVLRDLLEFLEDNNQKALFVVAPQEDKEDYHKQMNYMKAIIEEAGFQYVNIIEHFDELDFCYATDLLDGSHTNTLGAKKASDFLGKYLVENYELTDKRNKPGYEDWDASAEAFEKEYELMTIKAQELLDSLEK